MANSPYCDEEDQVRDAKACYVEEGAGIYHAALIDKSATIDRSTPEAYMTSLLAAEAVCKAHIIRNTYGEYDGGTKQYGKSYGGGTPKPIGAEHSATFADPQYVGNEAFWNAMQYQGSKYNLEFFTETRVWPVKGKALTFDAKGAIVSDFKEIIEGQITTKWNDKDNLVSEPANVADLATYPELALGTVVSNGDETYTTGTHTATVAVTGALDLVIPFTSAVTHSVPAGDERTALTTEGVTIADTGTALRLTAAANTLTAGTYTFTATGATACGISVSQQFTLIVTA